MKVAAVVLAAGRSERMGRPKALLPCRGKTFLRTILESLASSRVAEVRVVLGDGANEIRRLEALAGDIVVHNPRYEEGMLSSVRCGIRSLPADVSAFLLWPVDHPLVRAATVDRLVLTFEAGARGIVLPVHGGRRGHPTLFAARMASELLAAPDAVGARAVLRDRPEEVLEILVDDWGVVTNIDTPEAYLEVFGRLPGDEPS